MGKDKGMEIAQPLKCDALCEPRSRHMDAHSLKTSLYNYFKNCQANQTQIVVVIFPKQPLEAYGKVWYVIVLPPSVLLVSIMATMTNGFLTISFKNLFQLLGEMASSLIAGCSLLSSGYKN